MYAAHKKDINRHKSFHPLTQRNLGRVERRLEEEEAKKKAAAEREVQLRQDQEQRRYDDLLLAASADTASGHLAKFRQVQNIFAAESNADGPSEKTPPAPSFLRASAPVFAAEAGAKRGREEGGETPREKTVTGLVSTSDAAQLRKELDTLRKRRHDPLQRIERFQNSVVAKEAKRRALETTAKSVSSDTHPDTEKDAIRSRIQELLQMKGGK